MNRVFYYIIALAFVMGAWHECNPDPAPPAVEQIEEPAAELQTPAGEAAAVASNDAVVEDPRVTDLEQRVQALEPKVEAPEPPGMKALQDAILERSKVAVDLILKIVGAMCFFLGLMKVAEDGKLLLVIAKLIRPLMVRLFPSVPADHPAMGAMILNLSANALGLGNAATPFGIKAMKELDTLNRYKGTATNAMALFLAINTSSVTLLPTGVIVWREITGSTDPAAIVPTTLFATLFSTTIAIIVAKVYSRFAKRPEDITPPEDIVTLEAHVTDEATDAYPGWVSALAIGSLIAAIPLSVVYGPVIAPWIIPGLTITLLSYGHFNGVPVYSSFITGAKEGVQIAVTIVPYLVAILAAIGMFQASGALDLLIGILDPITGPLGLPGEALPMALLRPLSGSGAQGVMVSILENPATGPDTYTGFLVSTMSGSTETTFYVLAVYFGAVQVKRIRHTMATALTADLAGVIGSVLAVKAFFAFSGW